MKVRKQENIDAFRERILETAETIIQDEGIEKLSIRKITSRLDYTPGIIYHYFKNKEDILNAIIAQGYGEILSILKQNQIMSYKPSEVLGSTLRAYMEAMLKRRDIFLLLMNSKQAMIRAQVDILLPDIRNQRASIDMLCKRIEAGIQIGEFTSMNVERRAQTIWCATFGVMDRICKEGVDDSMQQELIEEHVKMVISSLIKR